VGRALPRPEALAPPRRHWLDMKVSVLVVILAGLSTAAFGQLIPEFI
jgi:hypothetical protein